MSNHTDPLSDDEYDAEFEQRLAATVEFEALAEWYAEYDGWELDEAFRIFDKVIDLITTTAQAVMLIKYTSLSSERGDRLLQKALSLANSSQEVIQCFNEMGQDETLEQENAVRKRMIELARTHADLDAIYYIFTIWQDELARRQLIRVLFDKADELDYRVVQRAGP